MTFVIFKCENTFYDLPTQALTLGISAKQAAINRSLLMAQP